MSIKYNSMVDAAFASLSKKKRSVLFSKLWEEVSKETGASNDLVAQFYSDITLDPRFTQLKDNKWDLTSRRTFSESHIDLSKLELDDDEEEIVMYDDGEEPIRETEEDL